MKAYLLRRVLQAFLTLLAVSVVVFLLARLTGDPVHLVLPVDATQQDIDRTRQVLGLDKPLPAQYAYFLKAAVTGDLGTSIRARRPVSELLTTRLPNSMKLATASIIITVLLGLPLGVLAAVKKGTAVDSLARFVAVVGQSVPGFWLGIVLIQVFAVKLGWLPVMGMGGPQYYIMPAFTLALFVVAGITRLLRSSMIEALDSDFVTFARMKGMSASRIVWKHALRNALLPVVTFAGLYFSILVTMAIVVEVVFAWPGIGRLAYEGIMFRDFPVVQGVILAGAALVMAVNLVVDIVYAYLDPRIRYGVS